MECVFLYLKNKSTNKRLTIAYLRQGAGYYYPTPFYNLTIYVSF